MPLIDPFRFTSVRNLGSMNSSAVRAVLSHTGEPGWVASLLDMAAPPGGTGRCVYVHFCFCCAAGDVAARVGRPYLVDCLFGGIFGLATCTNGLCWGPTRAMVREHYGNVPGHLLVDIAATTLLPCCYLAQSLNHMDLLEAARASSAALPVAPPVPLPVAPLQAVMGTGQPPPRYGSFQG